MEHRWGTPELRTWEWPGLEENRAEISDLIHNILIHEDTRVWFPALWVHSDGIGGPPEDPLTIYLDIACSAKENKQDDFDPPRYKANLRQILDEDIKQCAKDGSYSLGLSNISSAMRNLADEIDGIIAKAEIRRLRRSGKKNSSTKRSRPRRIR